MADATRSAPSAVDLEFARLFERISEQVLAGDKIDLEALNQDYPQYGRKLAELLPTLRAVASIVADEPDDLGPALPGGRERVLGDFRIQREVGRGGMGVVYEAEQISLGRRVALKILPFAAVLDERQLARFKNEAMAAALLEHPHIVPVYAVGCERGIHFYAMRFIEGQTLAEAFAVRHGEQGTSPPPEGERGRPSASDVGSAVRTKGSRDSSLPDQASSSADAAPEHAPAPDAIGWSAQRTLQPAAETRRVADLSTQLIPASPAWWRRLADLGIQAAEALEHAHQHGIVHRDVKPGNLLLDARGQLWVTDFGLAQVSGSADLTMTGDVLGTLRYMSPEQARGERILDQRTDVYSLGVTLYEMIVGHPAFPASDRQQLLRQIVEEEPTPPRQLNKRVPADLETIVLKAMGKEPEERYQSAKALSADLQRFVEERAIEATAPSMGRRIGKWARRHRRLVQVGLCGFLLAAVCGGALLWRERNETAIAWEQERRQRIDAQANLDLALQALESIYMRILGPRVEDEPELRAFQVQLLRAAQPTLESFQAGLVRDSAQFYSRIAWANRTNPKTKFKASEAMLMVAELNDHVGDQQVAEEAYTTCIAVRRELVARQPRDSESLKSLATANFRYGAWLADRGRQLDSLEALRQSIAQFEQLRHRFGLPFEPSGHEERARCSYSRALAETEQLPAAEAALKELNLYLTNHLEKLPEAFNVRAHLSAHLQRLARWREQQGDGSGAVSCLRAAIQHAELAAKAARRMPGYRLAVPPLYRELAIALQRLDRHDEAAVARAARVEAAEKAVADLPDDPECRAMLKKVRNDVAAEATTTQNHP